MDLVVAFPAMFWAGLWLWRRQPLGYVVAAILLIKAGLLGVTLVVNTWVATFWGVPADPAAPVYALGGLALAADYLGGLFDCGPDCRGTLWAAPHGGHRWGNQADFRTNYLVGNPRNPGETALGDPNAPQVSQLVRDAHRLMFQELVNALTAPGVGGRILFEGNPRPHLHVVF